MDRASEGFALVLSGLLVLAVVGADAYLCGTRVRAELVDVMRRVDFAVKEAQNKL